MKQKLINLGYALVITGLVLGGIHNILSSHPILSQTYNKFWTEKESSGTVIENVTEIEDIAYEEEITLTESNLTSTDSEAQTHTHTWKEDQEFIWVSTGNGKGHVEEKTIVKCDCGATQE